MRAQMMESFQNGVTKHNQYSKWNRKNNHSVKKMSKRYKIVIASVNYNCVHEKPFMIFDRFKSHTIGAFSFYFSLCVNPFDRSFAVA